MGSVCAYGAMYAAGGVFIHVMYRGRERERWRECVYGNMVGVVIKKCYPRRPHILSVEGVEPWHTHTHTHFSSELDLWNF